MKIEIRVIAISIFLGLLIWITDAVIDYFIFYEGTFLDLLIFDVPNHEMYIRFVVLFSFAIFGMIISKVMIKRKQAEEALRLERDNFINILDSMEDGVCIVDQQYNVQYVNPTLVKDYGLPEGYKCYKYFHDRKEVCPWCPNQEVFAGKSVHWEWYSFKNNRTYDLIDTPLKNLDGSISKLEILHDITPRKEAESLILKERTQAQQYLDIAGVMFVVLDKTGEVTRINKKGCQILGYDENEVLHKNWFDLCIHEDIRDKMWQVFVKLMAGKIELVEYYENNVVTKSGDQRLIAFRNALIMDEDSNITGILFSGEDITERKKAEEQIRKLSQAVEQNPTTIVITYLNGDIEYVNPQFTNLTGYTYEEAIGQNPRILKSGETTPKEYDCLWKTIISGHKWSGEFKNKKKNGDFYWESAFISPIMDQEGEITHFVAVKEDITEQKISQKRLQNEKDFSASLIQFSAFPLFVIDSQHKVLHWNKACEEFTGVKADDIIGTNDHGKVFYGFERPCVADIIISKKMDEFQKYYPKHSSSKLTLNGLHAESWFPNLGGKKRYIIFDAAPIENSEGKLIAVVESLQDITGIKLAEEKLKKYADELEHSNELKDLFTDILRHDLLNPAGIIKGYTELLLDMEKGEKKSKLLQKIEQNNEKLIDIIETAANFAKIESVEELEFETKDISIIVKDVADNFRPLIMSKQMEFEFKTDGVYPANVNPVIEEVFSNLLSNAIKYSPNESMIIVDILDVGNMWKLTVTDSGEGISDEDKPKLFERFKRVNKSCIKGTGLGLAIVKRIIELHGGSVGVEDNPEGRGSVFWVTLRKA